MTSESQYQEFLGFKFDITDSQDVIRTLLSPQAMPFYYLVTPNVSHVVLADKDGEFMSAMRNAAISVCDSQVLRGLSRLSLKNSLPLMVGSNLVQQLVDSPDAKTGSGVTFGVIGAHESQIEIIRNKCDIQIAAHLNPPMGFLNIEGEMEKTVKFMQENPVNIWFLAVGVPQQEILAHKALLNSGVSGAALCIGASLDFLSGEEKRAPQWISSFGLEWFYRLLKDPKW